MKHTVKWVKTMEYEEGWGVDFVRLDPDLEVQVYSIHPENVVIVGEIPCVAPADGAAHFVPIENFKHLDDLKGDDTHDLQTRWFKTHEEAETHAKDTLERWKKPLPWESFVQED